MTEEEIKELQETNNELVKKVGFLEKDLAKAIIKRDEAKKALEDNSGDTELLKELENYKTKLDEVTTENGNLKGEYETNLNGMRMMAQLKEMGIETHNSDALQSLTDIVLSDATYKDGAFVYLDEENTTRFNEANKPFGIIDRVNEVKESDKGYLFKQPTGGGATGKTGEPSKQNLTDNERARDMAKRLGQTT